MKPKRPTKTQKQREATLLALPRVKEVVDTYGRTAVNCALRLLAERDKKAAELAQLEQRVARLKEEIV